GRFRSGNECRWCEMADGDLFRVLHAYTDQGADVPGIAAWDEPATRQTYALAHQFLAEAPRGRPGLRAWKPLTVGWVPGDRAAGLVAADVQNCLGIRVARCSFRHAVTRSAVTFLRVS